VNLSALDAQADRGYLVSPRILEANEVTTRRKPLKHPASHQDTGRDLFRHTAQAPQIAND
jgi:hypothetical protein